MSSRPRITIGDEQAVLDDLVPVLKSACEALLRRQARSDWTSDELAQEVLIRLWKQRDSLTFRSRDDVSAWAYTTAGWVLWTEDKRRNNDGKLSFHDPAKLPEPADARSPAPSISDVMAIAMSDLEREVLRLYFEGLDYRAIAQRTNTSLATVGRTMVGIKARVADRNETRSGTNESRA